MDYKKELALKALKLASIKNHEKFLERIKLYNENPNKCLNCNKIIDYKKRNNKFCSKSCSASFNNKKRKHSKKTKEKISESCKGRKHTKETKKLIKDFNNKRTLKLKNEYYKNPNYCKICGNLITYENKYKLTCSDKCKIEAIFDGRKYWNGRRKNIYYFNRWMKKEILLESSWELEIAKLLDFLNIEWIRPKSIKWDDGNKNRFYFPDFYLSKYDIYLDPKNPYCMKQDKLKMKKVSKKINIIFGNIDLIKQEIIKLNEPIA